MSIEEDLSILYEALATNEISITDFLMKIKEENINSSQKSEEQDNESSLK